MEFVTSLGVSVITGLLSMMAFYYSFSKKAEGFYEETNKGIEYHRLFYNSRLAYNGASQVI